MSVSLRNLDPAFQGAGQKAGLEIWRMENFCPVPVPQTSYGRFCIGDSYIVLKTTTLKSGALSHEIHYWLGNDTSQDEAGVAAIKTVELDATLGGRAVQYREVQGHESAKFLSYFKPCIIPQKGGVDSGFRHAEVNESNHQTRLYVCKGKHTVRVKEVPFARSTLNHDDVFILDTESKVYQFNGSNSSIQERAKALEVVQYMKDTYHDGKCEVAVVEDGRLMADAEAGEFWVFFGGFAPLPRKTATKEEDDIKEATPPKLFCVEKEQQVAVEAESLSRELLETNKCYLLDCGIEVFIWTGKTSPLEERKNASKAAEEMVRGPDRPNAHVIRVMEGFETVMFRSKFDTWPQTDGVAVSEDGRGKVAALLKRQGINVKGLVKEDPEREEPQPYIDCTGDLQVWRVNGEEKILLSSTDQAKFYTGDCFIFQYSYMGEEREENLIGTWFGKKSIEEERAASIKLANGIAESMKSQAVQARLFEGKEPIQFYSIFQSFIVFKGGRSTGYKNFIAEKGLEDDTYNEDGTALFRVQGSGPENMQAIQVETVASSLNSSYCYILHSDSTVFTWSGSLTKVDDQELVDRQLDIIKPNLQSKVQKEGTETEQFWELLGGKSEYPNNKIAKEPEVDPHLFACCYSEGNLKVTEIFNFTQDDLMTEDIYIMDCRSEIFVWIGQMVNSKNRSHALEIGEKFLELDVFLTRVAKETPVIIVKEGSEPQFFTRFFTWDSTKSGMHGNSYERKYAVVKTGLAQILAKPKRRIPAHGGRFSMPEKSQRSRSMSFSPERARQRGKSPAFNALASKFENPNARNLSQPPPLDRKLFPKSIRPTPTLLSSSRSEAIAALTATFEKPIKNKIPKSPTGRGDDSFHTVDTIVEDPKEDEVEEENLPNHPYERLITTSTDPAEDIDVTRREAYLSSAEFSEKFGMKKDAFYKLPKWKQNKLKMAVHLF